MSKTKRHAQRHAAHAAKGPQPLAGQRVDGPHTLGMEASATIIDAASIAADEPSAADVSPSEAPVSEVASVEAVLPQAPLFVEAESGQLELMQAQAEELAAHLRERQRELDHREAQFHAALARCDHDARKARLLADERQQELDERQAAVEALAAELADRASRLSAAEQFVESSRREGEQRLAQTSAEAAQREEQLNVLAERLARQEMACLRQVEDARLERARAEAELLRRRQQLDARRASGVLFVQRLLDAQDRRRLAIERQAERVAAERREALSELQQTIGQWQARERRLLEAEAAHAQEREDLAAERRELEAWHAGVLARLEQERHEEAVLRQEAEEELATRRQTLERRAEQLDARRIALDQQMEEVRRLHREGLEARLAGEELWVQLSATAPTATLTRSLSRTRAQLTDQYRLANAELAMRKQELAELSLRLEQRFSQVHAERADVQQWVARRQEELERQAAQLVEHEQELEQQSAEVRRQRQAWNDERHDYQRQIQRLRDELRTQEPAPA